MKVSNRLGAVVGAALILGLCAACSDAKVEPSAPKQAPASAASGPPAETMTGTVPAGPGKETPETTSAVKSDISKSDQSKAMPMPGQANDHSTLAVPPIKK